MEANTNNNFKYSLVDLTTGEQTLFMEKFNKFTADEGIYFEAVPQFTRDNLQSPWKIVCQVLLQKRVPITEDKSIPSPFTNEPNLEN